MSSGIGYGVRFVGNRGKGRLLLGGGGAGGQSDNELGPLAGGASGFNRLLPHHFQWREDTRHYVLVNGQLFTEPVVRDGNCTALYTGRLGCPPVERSLVEFDAA